jgi:hypothetical protein
MARSTLPTPHAAAEALAAEARAIARDAYVYGFPLVDSYRIQHACFVDRTHPEFKSPWNRIHHTSRVYTPDDTTVQTPNSDTPYSMVGADLRAEPLVLTVPPIEPSRYFSVQFIDLYTFNFAYAGSRTTGNDGGSMLLAGPGWKGTAPEGLIAAFRCETELALLVYRTQLFSPADIEQVKAIQAGYTVQTLSSFLDTAAPPPAPDIDFITPVRAEERDSLEFFNVLNFVLQFCPTHPSEGTLMSRFHRIGVGPGVIFDAGAFPPKVQEVRDRHGQGHEPRKLRHPCVPQEELSCPHGRCRARHLRELEGRSDLPHVLP